MAATRQAKAVFLDRDGVLTIPEFRDGRSFAPLTLDGFHLCADAVPALAALKQRGFLLVVVTNQPELGTGRLRADVLAEMHRRLASALPVDSIKVCPHTSAEKCQCRKPLPGLLVEAAGELGIDLGRSYMVGDRAGDITAGQAAGCRSIFVDLGYTSEARPREPDAVVHSLREAVGWILANEGTSGA